jgi:UDP-N-acetylmuramyl pentapeptide phosphotransferase/UDP-N-acetylglucosamine-1-phosphate transferase
MSDRDNELKESDDILNYSQQQFDKLIVYLSSGALILTIGFVKDIVKITPQTDTRTLIWSWVLLAASLITNLFSHRTSYYSIYFDLKKKNKVSNFNDIVTEILNWLSFISLIAVIVVFIFFIINNINGATINKI